MMSHIDYVISDVLRKRAMTIQKLTYIFCLDLEKKIQS
jgi:hypothetical protein